MDVPADNLNLKRIRLIGEVVQFEPIGANVAPYGLTPDWALIKLCNNEF
jgi:hypothetical protein